MFFLFFRKSWRGMLVVGLILASYLVFSLVTVATNPNERLIPGAFILDLVLTVVAFARAFTLFNRRHDVKPSARHTDASAQPVRQTPNYRGF